MKRDVIYVYDGTLDGFLTCVFEAFEKKEAPSLITKRGGVQLAIGAQIKEITACSEKADRVYAGIEQKLGRDTLRAVWYATLSAGEDAETTALSYLRLGFKAGKEVYADLANPCVWRMGRIFREIWREAGQFLQFLRFSELEGGILFAEFEPEPHVLPVVMPHFADRLNAQPFIIHDKGRKLAGVYDTKDWYLISSEEMRLPELSGDEREYRELWKLFYNTIAVEERLNPKLRMQHMPKKYWKHMTEMGL